MKKRNKLKILNDPIYGFITIPNELLFDLIEHPYFQRLRRISQMGLSYLVYPGAHHTRFHHALGGMHLMQNAVRVLRFKGVSISQEEENALYIAILLHDIGHGPFSHAMEHNIVENVAHEEISLLFMEKMNQDFNGSLTLAIEIFKGSNSRPFLHQLISGQLDMDRMDYLKRDSFYTGVAEGNVNSERLITMLNVNDGQLVVEEKGIYSVEKFLLSRRLMYWQVYLHKTSLVAENLLIRVLKRAKELIEGDMVLPCSASLFYFIKYKIEIADFTEEVLQKFSLLDDYDMVSSMKAWMQEKDFVLSNLCKMIINRDLLKVKIKSKPFSTKKLEKYKYRFKEKHQISDYEASYFIFGGSVANQAYYRDRENIHILRKNGKIIDIVQATDQFNLRALSKPVTKFFICYPKNED